MSDSSASDAHRRHIAGNLSVLVWLCIATTLIYVFFAGSNFSSGDTFSELHVSDSILSRLQFDVPVQTAGQLCAGWGCRGVDGKYYATHGIGNSVFLVPFLLVARGAQVLFHTPACGNWIHCVPIHLLSWNTCLITGATIALLAWIGLRLGYDLGASLLMSMAYGFASMAWPYARYGFDVTLTALLLLAAVAFVLTAPMQRERAAECKSTGTSRALGAGICAALAILVRLPSLAAITPLALLLIPKSRRAAGSAQSMRSFLAFSAPILVALLFTAWYNAMRFGSILNDGHTTNSADHLSSTPWVGAFGILVSPGKGILWYCPAILLCLALLPRFYRAQTQACVLCMSMAAVSLLPYVLVNDWYGGDAWGPRFVLPVLPLIFLSMLEATAILRARWSRAVFVTILAASMFVQVAGQFVNYADRLRQAGRLNVSQSPYWSVSDSPLIDHIRTFVLYAEHPGALTTPVPRSQTFDVWWLNLWRIDGAAPVPSTLAGIFIGTLAVIASIKLASEVSRARVRFE